MRTTTRVAALALSLSVGLAALTACSDDAPPSADPSPTWSPTGRLETPTSPAAEPVEPELPGAATQPSEAGARAFIAYYWELINYAQVTGDVKALRAVSGPNCAGCNAGIKGIRQRHRIGKHVVGGPFRINVNETSELTIASGELTGYHAVVLAEHDAQTAVATDGTEDVRAAGSSTFDMYLIWIDGSGWRTDVMDVR